MKIFISWSKEASGQVALALHEWLPRVTLGNVTTWYSNDPLCLPKGPHTPEKILAAADDSDVCLAVITRTSITGWWLNFELGLFFGRNKPVYAILCDDVTHQVLAYHDHPLSALGVNFMYFTEKDITSFLISIKPSDRNWVDTAEEQVKNYFPLVKAKYDEIFDHRAKNLGDFLSNTAGDVDHE